MKKILLLLCIVIVFICGGCSNTDVIEPAPTTVSETIPVTVPETLPAATTPTKGAIQMTDKEKKEKLDTIKSKNNIEFPLSTEVLEVEIKISDTEYYTIETIFRVNKQDMESIYEQIDKQNEKELYQWEKWTKNGDTLFPKNWLYLVEGREDYVFFEKTTPGRGKGANVAYFLILPEESSNSYIIYVTYFGE